MKATKNEPLPAAKGSPGLGRGGIALAGVGLTLTLLALLADGGLVAVGYGYLWGYALVWSIVVGSLLFVGLQHLTHARWSVVLRRVPEMLSSPLWLVALLFVPVLAFALLHDRFHLFPWADAELMASDHLLHEKSPYLNLPFFVIRAVLFFALWLFFERLFVGTSLAQDQGKVGAEATLRLRRWSSALVALFGVTITFAGIDWLMSLSPKWFSTMFGVYVFAGMFSSSLAAITLAVVWMKRSGRLGEGWIRDDQLYSLGVLLFAFVCFWAYIAFSQFMLIWYGNLSEETFYYEQRTTGGWLVLSVVLALLRFVLPFLLLLPRPSKTNPRVLVPVSLMLLVGQAVDLYWLIAPQMDANVPDALLVSGALRPLLMLGPVLLLGGLVLHQIARFLKKHPPMPVGDPLLEASRRYIHL
ncbi:MAG: quinol:cytochrome C oxidoreductase [Deltaproteobacteria bacterium]|nr:quinol:cytochrome C oxidoreductase [Deltaproteobacteria bacterium]